MLTRQYGQTYSFALKDEAWLARIIRAAFPSYKKKSATVKPWQGEEHVSSYWDGGTKAEFRVVNLTTFATHPCSLGHPWYDVAGRGLANQNDMIMRTDHVGNAYLCILPDGFALVEAGTFCGKPATARVVLPVANFPKQLEA